jgi:hypothetical protein
VRDKIRKILKEEVNSNTIKYINHVVKSYMEGARVIDVTQEFGSASELRDLGWDDEMVDFAFTQYERFGFRQDPNDEDAYYHEGNPEHTWDLQDMLQDMFYNFIESKVKTGQFKETIDGWELLHNMWDVETPDGGTHVFSWDCSDRTYDQSVRINKRIDDKLVKNYGAPLEMVSTIRTLIIKEMTKLLDNEKKFC